MRKLWDFLEGRGGLPLLLVLIFAASFVLPFYFAKSLIKVFSPSHTEAGLQEEEIFPDRSAISPGGSWIRIPGNADFSPRADRDFLIVTWIKSRVLPSAGERMVILSSAEKNGINTQGFGLALSSGNAGIVPQVFWADGRGRGGWKTFLPVDFIPQRWHMFALSFYKGRYLGLHWARLDPGRRIKAHLSGGYELSEPVLARSSADITVGSRGKQGFRGKIGPFGIFTPDKLNKRISRILSDILQTPGEVPESVAEEDVRLWVRGGTIEIPGSSGGVKSRVKSRKGAAKMKQAVGESS